MLFDNHAGDERIWTQAQLSSSLQLNTHSRILLFKLNEKNHTITHFREISLPYAANNMGSVYLTSDNTLAVGYGSARDMAAQELDHNGNVRWSMKILNPMYVSYRAYKYNHLY